LLSPIISSSLRFRSFSMLFAFLSSLVCSSFYCNCPFRLCISILEVFSFYCANRKSSFCLEVYYYKLVIFWMFYFIICCNEGSSSAFSRPICTSASKLVLESLIICIYALRLLISYSLIWVYNSYRFNYEVSFYLLSILFSS
jgi:hypothetical protein